MRFRTNFLCEEVQEPRNARTAAANEGILECMYIPCKQAPLAIEFSVTMGAYN